MTGGMAYRRMSSQMKAAFLAAWVCCKVPGLVAVEVDHDHGRAVSDPSFPPAVAATLPESGIRAVGIHRDGAKHETGVPAGDTRG